MRVATIVGARPQFVKAAVVSRALRGIPGVCEILVHTGQHYDDNMSEVFFRDLSIEKPAYNLGIGSGPHGAQTGRMLEALESVLSVLQPDWVLIYGDTNSTLAGALAATKLHIPVAHVEAGLRSFDRGMPEEINRILSDHVADLLFAPTVASCDNLHREGVPDSRVRLVGDVMYDATLQYGLVAEARSTVLEQLQLIGKDYILATLHRAENTENSVRLRIIIAALIRIAEELPVILPLHPRTRKYLEELGLLQQALQHLRLVDPVGYLDMLMLEKNARLITTDSGGVQKEAFFHRVQCLTLRDQTEWVELVDMGWNRLVSPTSVGAVVEGFASALQASPGLEDTPYGDGHAGERIAQLLLGANPKPIKIPTTHLTVQIPPSLNS